MKKYRLKTDSQITDAKAGDIVYDCLYADYGVANDDTRILGYRHISVTLDKDGGYPFFTHPLRDLEEMANETERVK